MGGWHHHTLERKQNQSHNELISFELSGRTHVLFTCVVNRHNGMVSVC